ncbi:MULTISPECIES: TonB-dependent receptor [Paraburkholderia]|jgi:iron complex outermembrane receptor protein|uniref:Iron complex outermembrane recepter protein n=1 Tax=Paraburkholderia phenazinium TaxID=60549 RepID=A0A1N6KHD5_9BURK|nr:TonB-dependent receptor [Paraburkholderia phenazinium]SIO55746.1 iron complex outermembrane recepter protein [Paraburkholderia phenazinium]
MKQRALALAIRRIIWAELALTTAFAVPAFAQSQPAAAPAAAASGTAAAAAPAPASGAAASNKNVKQLKTFEVTGSLIRQADKTGFNSVQVISQKDIQQSGATSVSDYLRQTSANSASSWSDANPDSFAPGGAGIALRGLSEKYTLVLIDGQRAAPFAFAVNGTDTFFDLNTLPTNMIDRIEIVKTGAVSQYGSDAIAGVVNIITKHDFQGLQLDGNIGGAQHGGNGTGNFSILGGFGNLTEDGYNITAAASTFHQSGIMLGQRDTTSQYNAYSPASYWVNPATNTATAIGCGASNSRVVPASASASTFGSLGGTVCQHNITDEESLAPESDRSNIKIHGDFKINDHIQAFADVWESYNQTTLYGTTGVGAIGWAGVPQVYNPALGAPQSLNTTNVIAANNPYNPNPGVATPINYPFVNNPQNVTTTANFYRLSTGLKGDFSTPHLGDWNWAASYGHSQSEVSNSYSNEVSAAGYNQLLAGGYDFANPSATPNGLNGVFGTLNNQAISKLDTIDATISTPNLFTLPGGDVGIGFGAQFQHQSESIDTAAGYATGDFITPPYQTVEGQRNVAAVYYQIDIPIIKNLTFSQSSRYDHYSDFGGAFSPRFALRYQPVQAFTTYASFNRGFRAPTLIEDGKATSFGVQNAVDQDPASPQYGQAGNYFLESTAGNPNLQPERTKNYNIGFELSPTRTTDIGFDWYKIDITNVIGVEPLQGLIDQNNPNVVVRDPSTNLINFVNTQYVNESYLNTDGFEATLRQSLPTPLGTFTVSADWAYVLSFKTPGLADGQTNAAGNNSAMAETFGASFPRWKGNTSLNWNYHQWNATLTWQYTGPYEQDLVSGPGIESSVPSYSQFNLYAQYTGFKHWTLYAGIDNIFNRAPPYDPYWFNTIDNTGYDVSLYSYIGRYAQIGATYKF